MSHYIDGLNFFKISTDVISYFFSKIFPNDFVPQNNSKHYNLFLFHLFHLLK